MVEKLRLLWNAKDHPELNSGYGIMSRHLLPLLAEHYGRENILVFAPVYHHDYVSEWQGMKLLPGHTFDYDEMSALEHYEREGCNLLLQVGDIFPLGKIPDAAAANQVDWVQWLPVDWVGMSKNVANRIKPAHKIVPFTKYGEQALRAAGFPNIEKSIWLGLNTAIWRPQPRAELSSMMHLLGFEPTTFNILIVAANQERKNIYSQLEAIRILLHLDPSIPVRIYLHTQAKRDRDIIADLDELELGKYCRMPDPYTLDIGGVPEVEMAKMFNCADVVLNVCMEGFGLSMTQAQACGVPVVYLDVGPGDELVSFGAGTSPGSVITAPNLMATPLANPPAIAYTLGEYWKKRKAAGHPLRSEKAAEFIRQNFSWETIAAQWVEVIDRVLWERERYCYTIPLPDAGMAARSQNLRVVK